MTDARKAKYPLQCLVPGWLGGEGYIAGLPVLAVVLREAGSVSLGLHEMFDRIQKARPRGADAPRLVAFLGDERYFDDQLLMIVRLRLCLPCYAEYSGEKPMEDRFGLFPRWDHASVKLRHAKVTISGGMLFHSVVVPTPQYPDELVSLGKNIDRAGFQVTRYASASGRSDNFDAKVVRAAASSGFRMTRPTSHEPLPIA